MNNTKSIQVRNNKSTIMSRLNSVFFLRKTFENKKMELGSVEIQDKRRHCIQDSKSFDNESLSSEYSRLEDRINHMQSNKHTLI